MKTSKLSYVVEYQDRDTTWHTVACVTLAEARLVAVRSVHAIIKPVGCIEYWSGTEIQDFNFKDFEKTSKKNKNGVEVL